MSRTVYLPYTRRSRREDDYVMVVDEEEEPPPPNPDQWVVRPFQRVPPLAPRRSDDLMVVQRVNPTPVPRREFVGNPIPLSTYTGNERYFENTPYAVVAPIRRRVVSGPRAVRGRPFRPSPSMAVLNLPSTSTAILNLPSTSTANLNLPSTSTAHLNFPSTSTGTQYSPPSPAGSSSSDSTISVLVELAPPQRRSPSSLSSSSRPSSPGSPTTRLARTTGRMTYMDID